MTQIDTDEPAPPPRPRPPAKAATGVPSLGQALVIILGTGLLGVALGLLPHF